MQQREPSCRKKKITFFSDDLGVRSPRHSVAISDEKCRHTSVVALAVIPLKLRFRVGDVDPLLIERRKLYRQSSRVEQEEGAQGCPCGNTDASRSHVAGEM